MIVGECCYGDCILEKAVFHVLMWFCHSKNLLVILAMVPPPNLTMYNIAILVVNVISTTDNLFHKKITSAGFNHYFELFKALM